MFPFDWYWLADDGRVFSSARCATVDKTDAGFVVFGGAGHLATRWPADDTGAQTAAALDEVLVPLGIHRDLSTLKLALQATVDAEAEDRRLRFITGGAGQAMVYLQKQTQAAQALADPSPAPGRYALLTVEVGLTVDPSTGAPAVDVAGVARAVAATVQAWLPIAAAIEAVRLKAKAAIAAAATAEAARAAAGALSWPAA